MAVDVFLPARASTDVRRALLWAQPRDRCVPLDLRAACPRDRIVPALACPRVLKPRVRSTNPPGTPAMTKLGRSATILCLCCAALVFGSPLRAQTSTPIGEQIAKVYGLDGWGQIE